MPEKEYQRLTRGRLRRAGFLAVVATRSSLWLAKDHLLCVDSNGYTEEYKRFHFRDIQTLTLRVTDGRRVRAGVYGFLTGACALLAWVMSNVTATVLLGIIGVPCAILFAFNLALGPMCVSHLRTAVQVEELPSLNRLRRARKVLNRVRPLIEAAQGQLEREEIELKLGTPPSPDTPPVIASSTSVQSSPPPRHYRGKAHLILFWLLLADLPVTVTHFIIQSGWFDILSWLMLLATVGVAIAALVQQRNTDLPDGLKIIPKAALIFTSISFVTALGYGTYFAITHPEFLSRKNLLLEDPVILVMSGVTTSISVIMGGLGLMRLKKFRSAIPVAQTASIPGQDVS